MLLKDGKEEYDMAKIKLMYAVCQYTPNVIRDESVNVALVVHCPDPEYAFSDIFITQNVRRIQSFDDEFDMEYFNIVIDQFKEQFIVSPNDLLSTLENYNSNNFSVFDDHFIENRAVYYVNEFHFKEKITLMVDDTDIEETCTDLKATYLYYDLPKSERIDATKVRALLRKEIKNLKIEARDSTLEDMYNDDIFDFENDKYLMKAITLDYKNSNSLKKEMKMLVADIMLNKNKIKEKKLIIVYKNIADQDSNFNIANQIKEIDITKDLDIEIMPLSDAVMEVGYN